MEQNISQVKVINDAMSMLASFEEFVTANPKMTLLEVCNTFVAPIAHKIENKNIREHFTTLISLKCQRL